MKIKLGDKITMISKITSLGVKSTKKGTVIESVNPSRYPFTLKINGGGVTPIYTTELNNWNGITEEDSKTGDFVEKMFLGA